MAERVSGSEARGVMLTQMGLAMMASRWSGARDILVTVGALRARPSSHG